MPATTPRPPSLEQVAAFDRTAWSRSIGIPGRDPRNPQFARIGIMQALNRGHVREFNPKQ
jgi:hypothetical protein